MYKIILAAILQAKDEEQRKRITAWSLARAAAYGMRQQKAGVTMTFTKPSELLSFYDGVSGQRKPKARFLSRGVQTLQMEVTQADLFHLKAGLHNLTDDSGVDMRLNRDLLDYLQRAIDRF